MIFIILPNQLFEQIEKHVADSSNPSPKIKKAYVIEHELYFSKWQYHKTKLVLHRASMRHFAASRFFPCEYIDVDDDYEFIFKKHKAVSMFDPTDQLVQAQMSSLARKYGCSLSFYDSPNFMCSRQQLQDYTKAAGQPYLHRNFYVYFRKKFAILMRSDGQPIGGKWSFDEENRAPFAKNYTDPQIKHQKQGPEIEEAIKYVQKYFSNNPGQTILIPPFSRKSALARLKEFVEYRLGNFGKYQDASSSGVLFGNHSVLSPLLNIGLLYPREVIDAALAAKTGSNIASVEGFVRQIFWREYMRFLYLSFDHKDLLASNYLGHTGKLNKKVWFEFRGKTGMPNVDYCLAKFEKYGYLHHIERLMHVGNFMLLCRIAPKEAYSWFMMFIDAYPWVMVPNVFIMSQYAAGPLGITRPYFSSSAYIKKMSDFRDKHAFFIWDCLYYAFINKHKSKLAKIYAYASAVQSWERKTEDEKKKILATARNYTQLKN